MSDRPIIFPAPEVRAILEGRKTQARRVLKPQPPKVAKEMVTVDGRDIWLDIDIPTLVGKRRLPYAIGDRLWVRETWTWAHEGNKYFASYKATDAIPDGVKVKWRSAIHMPRWVSRITLRVTDVRVQRLQDISERDAEAETLLWHITEHTQNKVFRDDRGPAAIRYFRHIWDNLNTKRGHSWDSNPWVVAITFEREE